MKTILWSVLLFMTIIHADFFNSEEKAQQKYEEERAGYCKMFTQKVIDYKKEMRDDELYLITFESYKKRKHIFCSKEEVIKKVQDKKTKVKKIEKYVKNIYREDERLCKIFLTKAEKYKKNMRKDALAYTTLKSYNKRARIFCSQETLDRKEKKVLNEDKKLCQVFQQGPLLCKKFDTTSNINKDDALALKTLHSFEKREKVFCSSKPLYKKDLEVYEEQKRLCKIFNDKIIAYQKNVDNNEMSVKVFKAYKKRAKYFCAKKYAKK
ncbi:hypothetical protein MNB_SV-13-69 [hydrothermal vent metagenome]|uniref:Uncharacterized protein n=1 Tax=hydrothermal vent metagenome TaxID=652676 RepID=A0A1W1CZL1_9ZZZZ